MGTIRKIVCNGVKKLRGGVEVSEDIFQVGYTFQIDDKKLTVCEIRKGFIDFISNDIESYIPCYSIFIELDNTLLHWEDVNASDVRKVEYEIPIGYLSQEIHP